MKSGWYYHTNQSMIPLLWKLLQIVPSEGRVSVSYRDPFSLWWRHTVFFCMRFFNPPQTYGSCFIWLFNQLYLIFSIGNNKIQLSLITHILIWCIPELKFCIASKRSINLTWQVSVSCAASNNVGCWNGNTFRSKLQFANTLPGIVWPLNCNSLVHRWANDLHLQTTSVQFRSGQQKDQEYTKLNSSINRLSSEIKLFNERNFSE